ncbi:MAG: hypothetical protein HQ517_02880 [SAR324 cluster bacterium]|nr:hypothetical protein [SAR324 cluster bacterium]
MWKKEQVPKKDKTSAIKKLDKTVAKQTGEPAEKKQPAKVAKLIKKTGSDSKELIDSLKKTIDAQDQTIRTMKKTADLLTPEIDDEELKGMTFAEVKRIAVTFLKNIKDLPAKIRG